MIDESPLLTIARPIERPNADVIASFGGTPASFIVDAMGGSGALDFRIKSIGTVWPFAGVALTCNCGPADNLALCAAVAQCQPGDVLVAATGGYTGASVVGDLLLGIAKNRGAAAFVTDGLVRDVNDIEALQFPVFALGATPNSPARNGPGTVGLPVQCGGLNVASGDIIVGDRDGVVVVPQAAASGVLETLSKVWAAESQMLSQVKGGLTEVGIVAELLSGGRVRRVDP